MAKFWALIEIIRAIFRLWNEFRAWQEREREAEAARKRIERDKAIEDLKKAKTDEEIWDAQDRIVSNKP